MIDLAALPVAEYATDDPFEWPINFPPITETPRIPSKGFGPADPEPPEEY